MQIITFTSLIFDNILVCGVLSCAALLSYGSNSPQDIKVRKTARISNQYNQVPHLTQDTKWQSNKTTINITNNSQEVRPFPSDDHKAAMNRGESMANTRHK